MMFNARRLKMNRSAFSVLFAAAALAGNFHDATAQTINPTAQTASPRVMASRNAGRSPANRFESSKVLRESASHDRAAASQSPAHLLADHADFESEFDYVSEPGRWTNATTH
jgi:hypothetical protein